MKLTCEAHCGVHTFHNMYINFVSGHICTYMLLHRYEINLWSILLSCLPIFVHEIHTHIIELFASLPSKWCAQWNKIAQLFKALWDTLSLAFLIKNRCIDIESFIICGKTIKTCKSYLLYLYVSIKITCLQAFWHNLFLGASNRRRLNWYNFVTTCPTYVRWR